MNRQVLRTALAAFLLTPLVLALPATSAGAVTGDDWIPGYIISDQTFFNGSAMSATQVQAFMDQKVSVCQDGYTCLKDYRQPTPDIPADSYCTAYAGSSDERASDIIAKVGAACNISQKAILVILQKEMSLVTYTSPSAYRFDRAMGYACPDTVPVTCDPAYAGFFYQVYLAARQFQRYSAPETSYHWYPIGAYSPVRYSTSTSCGAPDVFIENRATAALYYYTPYQPNAAALANLGGTGDACSAYGNRNFWKLYWDWFGSPYGTSVSTVTGSADSSSIASAGTAGATVTVSPAPGAGSAFLQYLDGGVWSTFSAPLSVASGSAHYSWIPPQTFQYRVRYGATYSAPFTITVAPPTLTAAADAASILSGASAGATVTVSPTPPGGTAYVQYFYNGAWATFSPALTLVGGSAHFTWKPPATFQYRFLYAATYSDPFTITVATMSGAPDAASIPLGNGAGASLTVSPAPSSGSAFLQYFDGGVWSTFSPAVPLVAGAAHFAWTPPATFQYRWTYGSTYSDPFTITVVPPTVTGTADSASIGLGGSAGASVSISPTPTGGTAFLQYLDGATWMTFSPALTVTAGSAHFAWKPPATFQYRWMYRTTYSDPFTITVVPPTVTGTADAASIAVGSVAGASVSVSPTPTGGTAFLQYLDGSTWLTFSPALTVVAGSAHYSWKPPATFQYRWSYGTTYSDPFTVAVVAPTATGTADSASIPAGGSAGATVSVTPTPTGGTAFLQYLDGSTWLTFSPDLTLTAGSAHYSWKPPATFQYRWMFGSTYSNAFTVTVVPPTVTGTADAASIAPGASAGATVSVSPTPTGGTAYVQYFYNGVWSTFSPALTITAGSAHYSWKPPATFQYRWMFGSTYSDPFTITVTATS